MVPVKLTGVVLRAVDYGEADRVVTLLTRERGKVSAFARGARASRRRFGGALEPFTLLTAEARERAGSDLLGLDAVAVVRGFPALRGDLARIACAAYAAELTRELVRDHEPHPDDHLPHRGDLREPRSEALGEHVDDLARRRALSLDDGRARLFAEAGEQPDTDLGCHRRSRVPAEMPTRYPGTIPWP